VPRSERFDLVDSLRAIAALSIVVYHIAPFAAPGEVTADAAYQLKVGVTLFFLISGFLLYRPFVLAHTAGAPLPSVRAYAWRRVLRIVPAYWAALTVAALVSAPEVFDRPLLFYGFAQVYDPDTAFQGIAVAWSLCVEVTFYVMLPFFALASRALARRLGASPWRAEVIAVAALFVVGLGWRTLAIFVGGSFLGTSLNTLPAFLDWFAVGMALAIVSVRLASGAARPAPLRLVERLPALCWALAAAALAANAWLWGRSYYSAPRFGDAGVLAVHLTDLLCALGLMLPAVFVGAGTDAIRRLLASRALVWVGLVSYGVFLWQSETIRALGDHVLAQDAVNPNLLWLPLAVAACIVAGAISWYVLERPMLSLRRLVPDRRARRRVAEAEEAGAVVAP
jgi:peptidoglycan/LPS O-acetylase OafA/YrhL